MSQSPPLWALTAMELAGEYRSGATNPELVLESVLQRIEEVNPRLNAVVTLDLPGARQAAKDAGARWRSGQPFGKLDGVPLTIKDNLFVGGLRATWGSKLFANHVAPRDDLPVVRLRSAGCVIVGKTNTPELAMAGHTNNLIFGSTGNPWAPELSPGGSSGGAVAAVGSGCAPLAIATDAGGSIRRPAGLGGVAGLKPGLGRVRRRFGFPPLAGDLQVIGPVARSVADLRTLFAEIAVSGGSRPISGRKLRIGAFGFIGGAAVEPEVTEAFEAACAALREIGHDVEPIAPMWDREEVDSLFGGLVSPGIARVVTRFGDWQAQVSDSIANQAKAGATRSAVQYVTDLDRLIAFRWRMLDAIVGWDAIATPSAASVAWPRAEPSPTTIIGSDGSPRAGANFSTAVNLAGLPAIVVPAPVIQGRLPVGLQLIGAMNAEERLLDLAEQFETARPWPRLAPISSSPSPVQQAVAAPVDDVHSVMPDP